MRQPSYWKLTIISLLESALYSDDDGLTSRTLYVAFIAGSSKHGNASRAYVGSNLDVARNLKEENPCTGILTKTVSYRKVLHKREAQG